MNIPSIFLRVFQRKAIALVAMAALTACGGADTSSSGGSPPPGDGGSSSSSSSSGSTPAPSSAFKRGEQAYLDQCAGCHGEDGQGGTGGGEIHEHKCPAAAKRGDDIDCSNLGSLSGYLSDRMPVTGPTNCTNTGGSTCAADVATYMLQAFAPIVVAGDRDSDGIKDDVDACPDTLPQDIPSIDATGCKTTSGETGLVIAVNAGGGQYIAKNNTVFLADDAKYRNVAGNVGGQDGAAIANTEDDPIYAKELYVLQSMPLIYNFDVTNGSYKVVLHFAEPAHNAAGARIFDVDFESTKILNDYDIFVKAGGQNTAVKEESGRVEVTDGKATITITPSVHNAKLNGIELWGATANDGDKDGVLDARDSCPGTAVGATVNAEGCSEAQRDRDGDGILEPTDVCPSTPANQHGTVTQSGDLAGCSAQEQAGDKDGDGVPDVIDQCTSEPGAKVGRTGCSGITKLPSGNIVTPQIRLTVNEFTSTVKDAFGVNRLAAATFQSDNTGPFKTYVNNAADDTAEFDTLVLSAQALAKGLAGNYANRCNWASNARTCVNSHLTNPLKTLYRLNTVPAGDLQAIADVVKKASDAGASAEQAVGAGIARALIDERAIYRLEKGSRSSVAGVNLTTQEFANRLSYLLTDSAPDGDLSGVLNNLLGNKANITRQFERLKSTDRYGEAVWDFVSRWLGMGELTSTDLNTVKGAAREETRRFVKYILVDGNGTLEDLFTADYSFINRTLASHYGVPAPDTDWELYTFPAGSKRAGILTHASFLIGNGEHGRKENPIYRGKVVFENLFCNIMPPAPPGAVDNNDAVADRTVDPTCKVCHAVVDPIGYIFDEFDGDGKRYPSVTRQGALGIDTDIDGSYVDVLDFARQLSGSNAMTYCMTRQLYRFALGRDAYASEQASFDQVRETLNDTLSLNDTIATFLSTQSFAKVHAESNNAACPR